ncbi:ATPase with role in protein import into the ER, partial [Gryganskiella cystojenkinii]
KLTTSAESIIRQSITFTVIVLPDGQNVRTTTKKFINHELWENFTSYVRVYVDGNDPRKTQDVMLSAASPHRPYSWNELYKRTSAAIFPFDNGMEYRRVFLVYRLISSRFEVSVREVDGGEMVTRSSIYYQHLGGNDFNRCVVDHLLHSYKNKTGQDLSGDDMFRLRLGREVEMAKQVLSVQDWDLNMDLFTTTITTIDQAIKNSLVYTKDEIQDIVFSGGSANIPFLQSTIKEYFGPHKKYHGSSHPEATVVLGAAKLGHWYQDERHFTGGVCCTGASIAIVGIETAGGAMFKYTDQNSYWTVNKMYTFTTTKDYQDQVVIRVYRGKGKWTSQNRFLGKARLTGITPAPKGTPQIRVWLVSYGCGNYINLNVMDVPSGRINATIIYTNGYGEKFNDEIGAFELEPAGKLIVLH